MKRTLYITFLILASKLSVLSQTDMRQLSSCNNEDFESSSGGIITNSLAVSGWTINKLGSTFSICNSTALAATNATYTNPIQDYVELFDAPTGTVDPVIGPSYTIFSVFGSGSPNMGSNSTPSITNMYGDKFIRIHRKDTNSYVHHSIEKTISVTASNSLFRFAILPIVESSSGGCCSQPGVYIRLFNVSSNGSTLLACPAYSITQTTSQCPNPLSQTMNTVAIGTGRYHKWRIHAVDLSPYIGTDIKFKVANMNCAAGCLHFGYTYLDAQCGPMEIYVNNQPFPAHTNSVTYTGCGVSTATVVAPPDFSSYQWAGPAGFSSTLSTITTSAVGIYTLNIMASGTCSTITKYINIKLFPAPTVSIASNPTLSCAGSQVTLTATGLVNYTWTPTGIGPTKLVTPTVTTGYTVSGNNVNGCSGSAILTHSVKVCTALFEDSQITNVSVYPNPNDGEFEIDINSPSLHFNLIIYNALGQSVYQGNLNSGRNSVKTFLPKTGIYFYTISSDNALTHRGILVVQ